MRSALRAIASTAVIITIVLCTACSGNSTSAGGKSSARATASAATTASLNPASFVAFVGTWGAHSGELAIRADGRFTLGLRVYVWCSDSPPPCDNVSASVMVPGDRATGQLSSVIGNEAMGEVTQTTDPALTPRGRVIIRLQPQTDSVTFAGLPLCGPDAPALTC